MIGQAGSLKAQMLRRVIVTFEDLIRSCTISGEENAYLREGIPIPEHQQILREIGVRFYFKSISQITELIGFGLNWIWI